MTTTTTDPRAPQRVRHDLRFRLLSVRHTERLSPHMIRVVLQGDLAGFTSLGFDDHVKVFFPDPATGELVLPTATPDGIVFPADKPRPAARDYTPRAWDLAAGTLTIDFAVHDAGPATTWAVAARAGDVLGVGGPRGSFVIPMAFDGYLLIGDDTALPAIARRLAELPAGAPARVLIEVDGPEDRIALPTQADATVQWVYRAGVAPGASTALLDALPALGMPPGDFHAWVACESGIAKALRAALIGQHGAKPAWVKAAGYWRRGAAATHDTHAD